MESREYLRTWEQTGWPEDGFAVAANREDLEKLERRHADREAFTYTVMNLAETECLGCVYLMPTNARMFAGAHITLDSSRRPSMGRLRSGGLLLGSQVATRNGDRSRIARRASDMAGEGLEPPGPSHRHQ